MRHTRRRRAPRALREALSWRAEDPLASPRERIHAALALEAHDRAAALTALERIAEEPLHGDPVLPPMVRARIAWLRPAERGSRARRPGYSILLAARTERQFQKGSRL